MVATTAVCPVCAGGDTTELGHQPAVPTNNANLCDDAATADRLVLVTELFGDEQIALDAEALVCRHTLEHIREVHGFLSMLHRWAAQRPEPPIVLFEVPDVERVLDEVAFWDLFYEHCSYLKIDSQRFAFV